MIVRDEAVLSKLSFLKLVDTYLDSVTLRLFVLKLVGHMFA